MVQASHAPGVPIPLLTQSVAIVVAAQFHNPSILNHDFLLRNRIIDENWGNPTDFFSTPPYSTITYKEKGIQISCQELRLQFQKSINPTLMEFGDLVLCASDYIRVLEHVKYTGYGLNCQLTADTNNPPKWAKNHFLR